MSFEYTAPDPDPESDWVARLPGVNFNWRLRERPVEKVRTLAAELAVPDLVALLLFQRGLEDPDKASSFLDPRLEDLHDPFLMQDMDRSVERILRACGGGEKILIYGDYDVDGITSTAVLRRALEMLGGEVDIHIPARLEDGYGLRVDVLQRAKEQGFPLVISTDSGVRAFEVCRAARELGIDLIVTDHHVPDTTLPDAYSILNPKRPDCPYPEKNLAAVGVVFKLVQALFERGGKSPRLVRHFLKLVSIGTVADVVPLTGENRIIVKHGLEGLAHPHNLGLRELLHGSGAGEEVGIFDIAFKIAPRINAVTRMGGGREVVDLFSLRDRDRARLQVKEMNLRNDERRQTEAGILEQIEERYQADSSPFERRFLTIAGQGWHRGVIGIVASRLAERFHRPALVLSVGESDCQGSGRSIPAFNLVEALDANAHLFTRHGGHAQAVGCTLDISSCDDPRLTEVARQLEEYAARRLSPEDLVPKLAIDSVLSARSITSGLFDQVQRLQPFGCGNPTPVFASENVEVANGPWVLKNRHLKFQVRSNGRPLDAIWWKRADRVDNIPTGSRLDVAFTMSREVFRGEAKLLLTVKDLRPTAGADSALQ